MKTTHNNYMSKILAILKKTFEGGFYGILNTVFSFLGLSILFLGIYFSPQLTELYALPPNATHPAKLNLALSVFCELFVLLYQLTVIASISLIYVATSRKESLYAMYLLDFYARRCTIIYVILSLVLLRYGTYIYFIDDHLNNYTRYVEFCVEDNLTTIWVLIIPHKFWLIISNVLLTIVKHDTEYWFCTILFAFIVMYIGNCIAYRREYFSIFCVLLCYALSWFFFVIFVDYFYSLRCPLIFVVPFILISPLFILQIRLSINLCTRSNSWPLPLMLNLLALQLLLYAFIFQPYLKPFLCE